MMSTALLAAWFAVAAPPAAAGGAPRRLAVVVGVEDYGARGPILPASGARQDAARVAEALERAGFDQVRLYTDASATRANLEQVIAREIGPRTGPADLFLLYLACHGIGGDFGEPRLLLHDTDPDAVEQTSWPVSELAARIAATVRAGHVVVLTDTARPGSLGGLALLGPQPDQWPALGPSTLVMSATGPREVGAPGALADALAAGLDGAADSSGDGRVSSGELARHLALAVPVATRQAQHPTVQASHDPAFEVARLAGARAGAEAAGDRVDKVKFTFLGGVSPTVACAGAEPQVCDPSCVVWNVEPGTCEASAVLGGTRRAVQVRVDTRGGWTCAVADGRLACREGR